MRRFLSIVLLLLFVGSQINLAYGTHYCAGHPVKSSFMLSKQHLDCGMNMKGDCEKKEHTAVSPEKCCTNDYISISTSDDFKSQVSLKTLSFSAIKFFYLILENLFRPFEDLKSKNFICKGPPLSNVERHLLLQVFRI